MCMYLLCMCVCTCMHLNFDLVRDLALHISEAGPPVCAGVTHSNVKNCGFFPRHVSISHKQRTCLFPSVELSGNSNMGTYEVFIGLARTHLIACISMRL